MKAIRFYSVMPLALLVLIIEVPAKEIRRAWRNLRIIGGYRDNLRRFKEEWRKGP